MPNFDFKCASCGHVFEAFIDGGRSYANCHKCGLTSYKLPSAPAFKVNGYRAANGYSNNKPWLQKGQG
jgi:putative FmdB family regulatory protein